MTNVQTLRKDIPFAKMTDADLMAGIRAQMRLSVESIEKLAVLVREARRRNLSLAEFSTGLPARLIAVADEKLEAEILLKFCDRKAVLDAMVGVPLKSQRELAAGGMVPVVEIQHDGRMVAVDHTLRQMTGPQARQVFANGRILTPDEQRSQIKKLQDSARVHRTRRGANPANVKIEADMATGDVVVGGYRLKPRDFTTAFKALGFKVVRVS